MITFGREITNNATLVTAREWLVTNGIGGYAAGTLANVNTRRYHGMLVAALNPPLDRTVIVSKFDETVNYDGHELPLYANQWGSGDTALTPMGYLALERFHLEGTIPVWTYAIRDARLEKRVWMEQGANTTYIQYTLKYATYPLKLTIKTLVNYRDFHGSTHAGDWQMQVDGLPNGIGVEAFAGATPFYILSDQANTRITHEWYRNYFYAVEAYRGLDATEDNLYIGNFHAKLQSGESITLIATTDADAQLSGEQAYERRKAYDESLVTQSNKDDHPWWVQQLVRAADQFIVRRSVVNQFVVRDGTTGEDSDGRTVIAGYPWFGDWGRDTMISLPGLTLTTGREAEAAKILRTFAQHVDQGMLPNRFPDNDETPEYNTVDATLWYLEAIRAYHAQTSDLALLRELFPILQEIIDWHRRGTRYGIQMDQADGLLRAGEAGVQLTWMDAKVGDWVVTPRAGKVIEINALWYNALRTMAEFAQLLAVDGSAYTKLADQVTQHFTRFWNAGMGYCYDVVDSTDGGDDPTLRPNQLFAVSLPHSPLTAEQQRAVVDVCARELLTSAGLRSLSADHPDYRASYGGGVWERDSAYHQGTVWQWLIGPYLSAHFKVYGDKAYVRYLLQPLVDHLADGCVGSISEIADADAPHHPHGCMAQAWSVAEVLRVWDLVADDSK